MHSVDTYEMKRGTPLYKYVYESGHNARATPTTLLEYKIPPVKTGRNLKVVKVSKTSIFNKVKNARVRVNNSQKLFKS